MSHNKSCSLKGAEPIRSVMCPGLGTAVGRMPFVRCAEQVINNNNNNNNDNNNNSVDNDDSFSPKMVAAYETVVCQSLVEFISPQSLMEPVIKQRHLITVSLLILHVLSIMSRNFELTSIKFSFYEFFNLFQNWA